MVAQHKMDDSPKRSQLIDLIDDCFDRDELRFLCFDIGVKFDHLRDAGLRIQIEELLLLCLREGREQALLTELNRLHPDVHWPTTYSAASIIPLDDLRKDALNYAKLYVDRKSRILKPQGKLPKPQNLFVTFHDKNINYRFSKKGDFEPLGEEKLPPPMLFSDVVKRDQRILLLGDLGTGKSTIVGLFVSEVMATKPEALALLVPASAEALKIHPRATIQDVLNGISIYLNDHISLKTPSIEFRNLLDTDIPIYIIIDGLDEISSSHAANLLSLLHETASHYPNLWVITTGRPVELRGVDHQNWQIVRTLPLQNNEKIYLFQAEGVANGLSSKDAKKVADQILTKLKNIPTLNSLATTPLTIRLLYDRLLTTEFDVSTTLGDLLYELLKERLGKWAQSDQKAHAFEYFEKEFPDEFTRITLFGEFALRIKMAENLSIEQSRLYFRGLLESKVSEKTDVLAKEAVEYLIRSGIVINEDDQLRFAIQPLLEFLTGFGLAEKWIGNHSTPDWLQLQHWRIVSFAATVIRKLGTTNEFRSYILNYLENLLVTDRNIPAACYIIVELQDEECAIALIEHVSQMGIRPLTYFGDEKEQSTRAIASTIKLAGQKGFDWFYEHYLDPRYPIIHTASGLLDDVFEQWVYISQNSLTDYERNKLRKLVWPHIAANTHQTYSLLPALAILMPDAFEPKEAFWLIKKYLGRGPFSAQAEGYFVQEFQKGNTKLVNNALLQIANQGYEMAKSAAWLWLTLNPHERPHTLVLKTLLSAYGRSYLDISREKYLSLCERQVGQKQWHQFLRWCLFHKKERLAAGAAIELYKLGEKRLSMLGKPLLEAMHDGGYFKLAEETLNQIVKANGSDAVQWLANQIAATTDNYDKAHSGWWRIFLSELPSLGDKAPDMLTTCVGGVGPYLLPRYPEVRLLLRDLLLGTDGTRYRAKLRECLEHINPAIRHGAAMILISCNPQDEPLALENVIKLRHRNEFGSWHEWESFCLNLSFGPQVLTHLQAILPTLEASTKTFALVLLYRNNIELSPDEFTELVTNLLKVGDRLLDEYDPKLSVFADPKSYPILVEAIKNETKREAAAQELLRYHSAQLSPPLEIKITCLLASIPPWPWHPNLQEQIKKIASDPDYSEDVKLAMSDIVSDNNDVPILELIRRAITSEDLWETVVWHLLCNHSNLGTQLEDKGQWLLDFGRLEREYQSAIGTAVRKFLKDPRIQDSRQGEIKQWLALLADEFVGMSEEELRDALVSQGQPIWRSAASSLIARLDSKDLPRLDIRLTSNSLPETFDEFETSPQTIEELYQKLSEIIRPSEDLHPETCKIIEEICLTQTIPDENFTLVAEGVNGVLIVSALDYIYGRSANPGVVLSILGARLPHTQKDNLATRQFQK